MVRLIPVKRRKALKQKAVDLLVKNTKLNPEQAAQVVDTWQERFEKMSEKIKETTQKAIEKTNDALATISLWACLTLLLGLLATLGGSVLATLAQRKRQKPE